MKFKIYLLLFFGFVSFLSNIQKDVKVLFENEKLKLVYNKGSIEMQYNPKNWSVDESFQVRIFPNEKIYLGKEKMNVLNYELIEKKYLKKAFELENLKTHDIKVKEDNLKIVFEHRSDNYYIYYYVSSVYYKRSGKFGLGKSWIYYGEKPFWFELKVNNKIIKWEKYVFN